MPQQSLAQARVVDPILSQHARGYRQQGLIAASLFPLAFVQSYGGKTIQFGKESFRLYNSKRAPGSGTKRVTFGFEGESYSITPSALEAPVPREVMRDASQVPGIQLASRAVDIVQRSLLLEHEYNCAALATNAANYDSAHKVTLTTTDKWTGNTSDPTDDIETAKEAIRASIGVYPNTVVLSASAFRACKTNTKILDRIRYTGRDSPSLEILAALWGVDKVVVGAGVVATGAADTFGDIWGHYVVVAYVSPNGGGDAGANTEEPSYGYTYAIEGMPMVEVPYWDNNTKSWIYGVSFDNTPRLTAMTAGYLITDAGSPQ